VSLYQLLELLIMLLAVVVSFVALTRLAALMRSSGNYAGSRRS
jgi:hypothetical protein